MNRSKEMNALKDNPSLSVRTAKLDGTTWKTPFQVTKEMSSNLPVVIVDHLIVGAGPAGASMGCFLGQNGQEGQRGLIISSAPAISNTPRAHMTNPAAYECLRDIGLEDECLKASAGVREAIQHIRYAESMLGPEYGRVHSWGEGLSDKMVTVTPCRFTDLPQTELEPILLRYAALHGFPVRFGTELIGYKLNADNTIIVNVYDRISTQTYHIKTRYLYGADGSHSRVAKLLDLPFSTKLRTDRAVNVLFKADLRGRMDNRLGDLHLLMNPGSELKDHAWSMMLRMVKPWYEWLGVIFPKPGITLSKAPEPQSYIEPLRAWIGDDDIPIEVIRTDLWTVQESYAKSWSRGNIFCLGDAVHRHPPTMALGSNTCIQDAYNLAWKVGMVEKGLAGEDLLRTYDAERQPVGAEVTRLSNYGRDQVAKIHAALGMMEDSRETRSMAVDELRAPTSIGAARRASFKRSAVLSSASTRSLGAVFNQRYTSDAVYAADEDTGFAPLENAIEDYIPQTRPGCRLPHSWLNTYSPQIRLSTQDLAGGGKFTLFTGVAGGPLWKPAAEATSTKMGLWERTVAFSLGQIEATEIEIQHLESALNKLCIRRRHRLRAERITSVDKTANTVTSGELSHTFAGFFDDSEVIVAKQCPGRRQKVNVLLILRVQSNTDDFDENVIFPESWKRPVGNLSSVLRSDDHDSFLNRWKCHGVIRMAIYAKIRMTLTVVAFFIAQPQLQARRRIDRSEDYFGLFQIGSFSQASPKSAHQNPARALSLILEVP
ncbi:hypothetical protein N7510_000112 [Penicillium lagena]|uniref:uncharacterized protein n=1 Tax=Penicillium lagena TaxID=94218 RepID=UPI002540BF1C|nr:uncharacterized protein N7510_000112 [Penicillium lagena]KAJ5623803.1 hypothetical protein N7510_000112 [Penicillium lagena]